MRETIPELGINLLERHYVGVREINYYYLLPSAAKGDCEKVVCVVFFG